MECQVRKVSAFSMRLEKELRSCTRQRVVPILATLTGNRSYQEYVSLDAGFVWPVPHDMSDEVAAQFVMNPFTSYSLLHELQVPKGEYLL